MKPGPKLADRLRYWRSTSRVPTDCSRWCCPSRRAPRTPLPSIRPKQAARLQPMQLALANRQRYLRSRPRPRAPAGVPANSPEPATRKLWLAWAARKASSTCTAMAGVVPPDTAAARWRCVGRWLDGGTSKCKVHKTTS